MRDTCRIHTGYVRDTCILSGNQDTIQIHSGSMQDTCGIHAGYVSRGLGECFDAIIVCSTPMRPPIGSLAVVGQLQHLTRRQAWKGGNDRWKEGGEGERKRRWRASKKGSGYGGGWRTERGTMPKVRGANPPKLDNKPHVTPPHGLSVSRLPPVITRCLLTGTHTGLRTLTSPYFGALCMKRMREKNN
jgi:hypothetical protein